MHSLYSIRINNIYSFHHSFYKSKETFIRIPINKFTRTHNHFKILYLLFLLKKHLQEFFHMLTFILVYCRARPNLNYAGHDKAHKDHQ